MEISSHVVQNTDVKSGCNNHGVNFAAGQKASKGGGQRMVYFMSQDSGEMYEYGIKPLDGDLKKITLIDRTQDDGIRFNRISYVYQGRSIHDDFVPTKFEVGGPKRDLPDVLQHGLFLVTDKFKDVVEQLEPGVHQFFPVDLFWKDGGHAGNYYWFNVCNRLDSVDREKTTIEFRGIWYPTGDKSKNFVFSRTQIGDCHIWMDKLISVGTPFVTGVFKHAIDKANVTGLRFKPYADVE